MTPTQKALGWVNGEVVQRYRREKGCSIFEAKREVRDIALNEALKHISGWEDCAAILRFQHQHR